jgi:hypothetical protein
MTITEVWAASAMVITFPTLFPQELKAFGDFPGIWLLSSSLPSSIPEAPSLSSESKSQSAAAAGP